jgi:hypothetical protein
MAAPTIVGSPLCDNDNLGTATIPACAENDLVLVSYTHTGAGAPATVADPVYTVGLTSAGFTKLTTDASQDGSNSFCAIWIKRASASDAAGGVGISVGATGASNRVVVSTFNHPNGWQIVAFDYDAVIGTVGTAAWNPTTATWPNPPRPCLVYWAVGLATGATNLEVVYDGGVSAPPEIDEGVTGSALHQGGYKLYDSSGTPTNIVCSLGGTTNKSSAAVIIQANPDPIAATRVDETDTAMPVGRIKTPAALGLTTEADEAFPVAPPSGVDIATVTETDTAFAVAPIVTHRFDVGTVTETDTAFPLRVGLRFVQETDAAQPITWVKLRDYETPIDDPGNGPFTQMFLRALVNLTDEDVYSGDIRFELRDGSTVLESGPWQALTETPTLYEHVVDVGVAGLTDLRVYWQVRTFDELIANVAAPRLDTESVMAPVTETDTAFELIVVGGNTYPTTFVEELDTAFAVSAAHSAAAGMVVETDSTFAVPMSITGRTVVPVEEFDDAIAIEPIIAYNRTPGLVTEVDLAFGITGVVIRRWGRRVRTASSQRLRTSPSKSIVASPSKSIRGT